MTRLEGKHRNKTWQNLPVGASAEPGTKVPSAITSSDPRASGPGSTSPGPRGPWARVWLACAVLALLLLTGLELFWRSRGYMAGITANEELWSYHRERLEGAGLETVALLGGSRMQVGFRPEAFRTVYPGIETVQLAVAAKSPLATFQDLAADGSFRGVVVCSFPEVTSLPGWAGQEDYLRFYRQKWGPGERYSLLLASALQERLVLLQPRLGGEKLLRQLSEGRLPPINYYRTLFDRSRIMKFELLSQKNIAGLVRARIAKARRRLPAEPPASLLEWQAFVDRLSRLTDQIQARGGRVVFVRFPTRGRFERLTDAYFPRERYWELLASTVGAATLHYGDMPDQEALRLPDQSHLDIPSGRQFTRWIAEELAARGVLGAAL